MGTIYLAFYEDFYLQNKVEQEGLFVLTIVYLQAKLHKYLASYKDISRTVNICSGVK